MRSFYHLTALIASVALLSSPLTLAQNTNPANNAASGAAGALSNSGTAAGAASTNAPSSAAQANSKASANGQSSGGGATIFNCAGGVVAGIAHPDDDLLFQSPDLLATVQGGACYTLVIATMGDAGSTGEAYALSREQGNAAAYAQMAGVPNVWTGVNASIANQQILVTTLVGAPQIQRVHFRLPDGNMDGSG